MHRWNVIYSYNGILLFGHKKTWSANACYNMCACIFNYISPVLPSVTVWTELPGFSVHGILQARTLEWVAVSFSRGSSRPRKRTQVSCTAGRLFTNSDARCPPFKDVVFSGFSQILKLWQSIWTVSSFLNHSWPEDILLLKKCSAHQFQCVCLCLSREQRALPPPPSPPNKQL